MLDVQATFDFWRLLEALTPQETERIQQEHATAPVYEVALANGHAMPWVDKDHCSKLLPVGITWSYVAQCGVHDSQAVFALLQRKFGGSGRVDERSQRTRIFDLGFDPEGYPVARSFGLSLAAWAAGYLLRDKGTIEGLLKGGAWPLDDLAYCGDLLAESGFSGYDTMHGALVQWLHLETARMREQGTPADASWLQSLLALVMRQLNTPKGVLPPHMPCRVKASHVRVGAKENATGHQDAGDVLSSFFIRDLQRLGVAAGSRDLGKALKQFLQGAHSLSAQLHDVRDPGTGDVLQAALHPEKMPAGRWPSDHPLVFSQQLAVNEAWEKLRDESGLFAVNGPPGTGKTTMLRDVVAAVVTQRACVLADLGAGGFGHKESVRLGDTWVPFYRLHEDLMDHSIVVASSNNGAVENVTLEMPGLYAVPDQVAESFGYFRDVAEQVIQKPAWGLLAAPLGKSSNRQAFVNAFWWGKGDGCNDKANQTPGLRERLKALQPQTTETAAAWSECVAKFRAAQLREQQARASMIRAADRPSKLAALVTRRAQIMDELDDVAGYTGLQQNRLDQLRAALITASLRGDAVLLDHQQRLQQRQEHRRAKPRLMSWLTSWGRSHKEWLEKSHSIDKDISTLEGQILVWQKHSVTLNDDVNKSAQKLAGLVRRFEAVQQELATVRNEVGRQQAQMQTDMDSLGKGWLHVDVDSHERERMEPWASRDWQNARQELFLAALRLHKAFIEHHATKVVANVGLACDLLRGKPMPESLAKLALESLCLIVPVVSTTFASMPRMCASLGRESIGWLLIDEAGQALPSHAAGGLWRARRALVVGDPLQLEPVQTIPAAVESAIAKVFGVEPRLWPSAASAQSLADQGTPLGTWVPRMDGQSVWVGCPLRLHRRCDEPMFSISNAVAYGGQMVQGKPQSDSQLPPSHWLDVQGQATRGHWIEEEGARLETLLTDLMGQYGVDPSQVAMISPFRDVARQLKRIGSAYGMDPKRLGTVHTAQGKEADVVILVLGGDPKAPGAKAWAAAKPNLLNVAVSRARKRLYVIGDRSEWAKQQYFEEMVGLLDAVATC